MSGINPVSEPADRSVSKNEDLEITAAPEPQNFDQVKSFANNNEILGHEQIDPALNAKMHLINSAIDEIGWTNYHTKLFFLSGFGYAVDSMLFIPKSIALTQVTKEFNPSYPKALIIASTLGSLIGSVFWGLSADVIGRKWAFNISLFMCSISAIAAGAAPNWIGLCTLATFVGIGGGGNLGLDITVFLEYLPSKYQWILTLLAAWWGVGQTFAGFMAWAFMPNFSCATAATCNYDNNKGWRYVFWTCGAVVFVMSILRVTVIRLQETPKYLLARGKDEEVVANLQGMAKKYNRSCFLTVDNLAACGNTNIKETHAKKLISPAEIAVHFRGLFATKKIGLSTSLIWLSWLLIGLAYPLFQVFLPTYLASRGAKFGVLSDFITWRNYALVNVSSIFGPILAGFLARTRLGRRYTMVVGALFTMSFFFAYSQVKNNDQNLGFSCAVNFCLNIYYGTLYAYTPEVLPSAHRGTGNGVATALKSTMGIISAIIAVYADPNTVVPIYICAAMYILMSFVAAALPFEPYAHRSS